VLGSQPAVTPAAGPRILAIVLNWRQAPVTLTCVEALLAMSGPALDILVLDNGSGDDSVPFLQAHQEKFILQALPRNLGFSAANNIGLRQALDEGYDYALLVNNDAFAAPDMLEKLLAEVQSDIALLSPKIYYEAEPGRIWFANGRRQPTTLDLRDTGRGELDGPQYARSKDVDYLLGTCLLVNLQAARVVGLLDEQYFFYFEDLDWSLRFQQAGYRLRLVADAHLYHRVALSTGSDEDAPQRRYYLAYGGVRFWRSHSRLGSPVIIALFRLGSAFKMVARLVLNGRFDTAASYLRGLRDGWSAKQ
jgi:GT2 family glycosyltransferase